MNTVINKNLELNIYNIEGVVDGSVTIPSELFSSEVSEDLLAQYIKVYTTNQRVGNAHTKTRGEVAGTGKKPWKQKGTGRARAGSRRSPLWVGGGITHGPRSKNIRLEMPKKMRRQSLFCALTKKAENGKIIIVNSLANLDGKSKSYSNLLNKLNVSGSALLLTPAYDSKTLLGSRNVENTTVKMVTNLNAYDIVSSANLIIDLGALKALEEKYENK